MEDPFKRYILHIFIYIRMNFIFSLQKYSIYEYSYIFKEKKCASKALSNFPFPSLLTGMKFGFSRSRPKLRVWFLVFPVPVPNTVKAFWVFPFPSQNTKSDSRSCLPRVAGAVLQAPSSLINKLTHPFPPSLQNTFTPKP